MLGISDQVKKKKTDNNKCQEYQIKSLEQKTENIDVLANQLFGLDFVSKRVQYEANFTTSSDLTGFKQFCLTKALQEGNEDQMEIAVL